MKNYQNTSFLAWTKQFGTERDCLEAVAKFDVHAVNMIVPM